MELKLRLSSLLSSKASSSNCTFMELKSKTKAQKAKEEAF